MLLNTLCNVVPSKIDADASRRFLPNLQQIGVYLPIARQTRVYLLLKKGKDIYEHQEF